MQPTSEAAGRQSGPPRSALVYIYQYLVRTKDMFRTPRINELIQDQYVDVSGIRTHLLRKY